MAKFETGGAADHYPPAALTSNAIGTMLNVGA
ncbi:hypothetical protein FHW04_000819 [Pantoea sp. AN62]